MTEVARSALVPYTAEQLYTLVADVDSYPEFLPWCASAHVLESAAGEMKAGLGVDYHGVKQQFTTCNTLVEGTQIHMQLLDGPFKHLEGTWDFVALETSACRVDFSLTFEFSNFILHKVASPVFTEIANTMLDSFISRAEQLYD